MRIVIVGGGLVGSTLAEKLSRSGQDVALVESDAGRIAELSERLDAQVLHGNGTTIRILREAGIEEASLVVATTASDEANMVVGLIAALRFDVPRSVVRLRDPDHAESFARMVESSAGEHVVVNPDAAAVDRILSLLEVPGALDVVSFFDDRLLVAGFRIAEQSDFKGLLVSHMNLLFAGTPTLIAAIHRADEWIIPHGDEDIRANDLIYFAFDRSELESILHLVGAREERGTHLMVGGATRLGLELASRLEQRRSRVVLIDDDPERARVAAERLNDTLVVLGSITNQDLLEEHAIERVSTFIATSDDNEVNLVAGLLAKRLGARRAFALIETPGLADLIGEVAIDAAISPRLLAIGLTLQHIQGGGVHSVAALTEDRVEIIDADAVAGSPITSGALADVALPRGVLLAALRRGADVLLPSGDDRVEPGDEMLFITTTEQADKLSAYLSPDA
ncbi:MAG: Trk system potassium transporter TrkA [Deltaproteobacteria bacterium]|nr:MAG: Trk system potassium transporter TrkA [Deltaproteobacteria bacterium]